MFHHRGHRKPASTRPGRRQSPSSLALSTTMICAARRTDSRQVAITTGLRRRLSRDELAGVMAHELSHIRNYDIRFAMLHLRAAREDVSQQGGAM